MSLRLRQLRAWEILDSRGHPTLAVEAELFDSTIATAQVPAGASTGRHEAAELRDGDPNRYQGRGVLRAVEAVERVISPALAGQDADAVDRSLIALDKSRLGANSTLGVSCAVARAVALSRKVPLWQSLLQVEKPRIPVPMVNILSGGLHAGGQIEFQDFLVIPRGRSLAESLESVAKVHRTARELILERGYILTGVADEGGWAPRFESNEHALALLTEAIERAGTPMSIAIDAASSHFHKDGAYHLASERRILARDEMIDLLADWSARYPIASIEDGLAEDDWEGWRSLTARLNLRLIGDDLFATNPGRLARGIQEKAANAVLVKMNQIGTLTETFEVAAMARLAGYSIVVSARSGETEDSFLADLAIAAGADQIKIGSITRSERLAKYNRLLEIERKWR